MARERGNQNRGSPKGAPERAPGRAEGEPRLIPDLARRALSLGLSGFFLTEETIRKALGDSVPRDWTDFLAAQSERTRTDFLERLSYEVAQSLEKLDMALQRIYLPVFWKAYNFWLFGKPVRWAKRTFEGSVLQRMWRWMRRRPATS